MPSDKDRKIYLSVGAVLLFTVVLHYIGWLLPVEQAIQGSVLPILGRVHGFSVEIGNNYQFFKDRNEFISAYQTCLKNTEKNDVLSAEVKQLTDENTELRSQLNYLSKSTSTQHILANVVGREILSTEQTVIIDRGADDGIKVGDPVIVESGVLVGKIVKSDPKVSVARLLNDNTSRIGATVLNHDKSLGVVEGGFGISLKMNLIPRDEIVLVGDQVISSGLETSTPRGLLIGSVAEVENEPYKPFQQAVISPATDLSKLTAVSVLLTK
jgi:rod shape-determining protein MreC